MGHAERRNPSVKGWLYAGLAASVLAYAVGMATFDAFSFVQVTFLFFTLLRGSVLRRWR